MTIWDATLTELADVLARRGFRPLDSSHALTRAVEALESLEDCVSQEDHADAIKKLEKEVEDAERDASRHESRADDAESDRDEAERRASQLEDEVERLREEVAALRGEVGEDAVSAADQVLALRRELDEERERTRVALKRIETLALSLRTEAQRDRVRKDMVRVNAQNLADVVAREIEVRSP